MIDDPVSSLDHARIEAVARRLVREAAAGRQVIIFTHNLFFHYVVLEAAQEMKVCVREEWIAKHGDGRFGIIDDNQRPWISMGVTKRLVVITDLLQANVSTMKLRAARIEKADSISSTPQQLGAVSAYRCSD